MAGGCQHRAQLRFPETPHTAVVFSVYSPGHRQSRQRISHGIPGLFCLLRDCFCVTWKSQLPAGEGSYCWAVRILGQPCLIVLSPHLDWGFLLRLSGTSFYCQWSAFSILPLPYWQYLLILHPPEQCRCQPELPGLCQVEAGHGWGCLYVLCVGRENAVGVGSPIFPTCWGMWNTQRWSSAEYRQTRQFLYSPAVTLALLPSGLPTALPGTSVSSVLTFGSRVIFCKLPHVSDHIRDCFATVFSKLWFFFLRIPEWGLQLIIQSATWHFWALEHTCHGLLHC